ncbi:hypothetical protein PHMEG_00016007 [Phytophthora megakarya]|uniref:Uncharacterized protein n=1 Tax=Phytophthora megakarya TaxID=4795 RepID=A0A225W2E4_9STRA|nr:hypothetical protein PHMEG_00016007 [Phytophthora megakarya]
MSTNSNAARCKRKNLASEERAQVVATLLPSSVELKPPKTEFTACAARYGFGERQIIRLWQGVAQNVQEGRPINYESSIKGRSGHKSRLTEEFRLDLSHAIALTPLEDRTNTRTLADSLGIPKCHTACVKPMLNDQQRAARKTSRNGLQFDDMMNYVHLDEKWFYLAKDNQRFYLADHEEDPHLTVKNKNYIIKVMFLVAVARPRWDSKNHKEWDGKIGVWPFFIYEPVKRTNKNRPAGTLELKTYTVDRDIYRMYLSDPLFRVSRRFGLRATVSFCSTIMQSRMWLMMILRWSQHVSRSLQHKKKAKTIEDLVNNVDEAYRQLHYSVLDSVLLTLQWLLWTLKGATAI